MLLYLDSNVFIFAALSNDIKAVKSKELIKKIILGELMALLLLYQLMRLFGRFGRNLRIEPLPLKRD